MAKKRFRSYIEAERAAISADHENTVMLMAINDLINKKFQFRNIPIKDDRYRIGISRIHGAAGGILLVSFKESKGKSTTRAYYLEEYLSAPIPVGTESWWLQTGIREFASALRRGG